MKVNRLNRTLAVALGLFSAITSVAAQPASDTLQSIIDDHWAYRLEQNPVFATTLGVRDFDDQLGSPSIETSEKQFAKAQEFLERLEALDTTTLTEDEKINYKLLLLDVQNDVESAKYGGKYLLINHRWGPHRTIVSMANRLPFFTQTDYESYLARLEDSPRYLSEAAETLRAGVAAGWTQPCAPMEGAEKTILYHIVDDVEDSVLMKPFETQPSTISNSDWRRIRNRAENIVESVVIPAFATFAEFYQDEYAPACRESVGASSFPNGEAYYEHRARVYTTTDQAPEDIHQIGLREVARIRSEMDKVIEQSGFDGDFTEFQEFLRTDPQFYAKTADELVAVTSTIAKKADGALPSLFTKFPRMPYTVKPVPEDIAEGTTTAYYERPSGDGSRAGVYRINTSLLEQRPLFELEALSLHEAVPGHHFQVALAQELTVPNFRRYGGFTAFTEGWGLYAESLGLDAGFYQDPYSNFGRLSYEMWRASRLVVDTGLHMKGWTKQQAIDFMASNTALSLHNIEAEVNRYIVNPGQALAYKMGELKMQELRKRATTALGRDFDLRRFNDALLENGAVPLSVLEDNIDTWIADELGR
ncbi:DUF885 domain-containing protein [Hyphococcus flavus]|uniref:DUF885 domain-containing protein n=1 Tax=Hyphococcus flavus TaxID=1866326 RepID=A0AAF0CGM9_9PROT|nr:DUF885 domain-containing protein [Hyphococcus flavus]WDI32594.1 DUF885 domain-containing protein [Hyphococcus flavus]